MVEWGTKVGQPPRQQSDASAPKAGEKKRNDPLRWLMATRSALANLSHLLSRRNLNSTCSSGNVSPYGRVVVWLPENVTFKHKERPYVFA